jgi:hypothetical protein
MPKIAYEPKTFKAGSLEVIERANEICQDYADQGYDLTLRQLYYRFVAHGWIPNRQTEYKRLGSIVNDARMAGLMDWNHIVDRTRNLRRLPTWDSPADIIEAVADQYREDVWRRQPTYVEVWVEKDALVGVIQRAADIWQVPSFSCRGYTSQSELWSAAMRLVRKRQAGKATHIIHLGDHDPSGIDMTRDILDRMRGFCWHHGVEPPTVNRVALNMDQVEIHEPPPNPAKVTDSRFEGYEAIYGEESWELDALPPEVLDGVIQEAIRDLVDERVMDEDREAAEERRQLLVAVSAQWDDVADYVTENGA